MKVNFELTKIKARDAKKGQVLVNQADGFAYLVIKQSDIGCATPAEPTISVLKLNGPDAFAETELVDSTEFAVADATLTINHFDIQEKK